MNCENCKNYEAKDDGRWKPELNEEYFYIHLASYSIGNHEWKDDHTDNIHYKNNNVFKTREEAIAKFDKIKEFLCKR